MEKAKEKPPEFFKSIKTSLKSILKHHDINTPILNDAVIRASKMVIHTLQFLKLYLLDYYEKNHTLPMITQEYINNSMKVICGEKEEMRGKPPSKETIELKEQLTSFYKEYYLPTTQYETICYTGLNTVMDYLKEDIMKITFNYIMWIMWKGM